MNNLFCFMWVSFAATNNACFCAPRVPVNSLLTDHLDVVGLNVVDDKVEARPARVWCDERGKSQELRRVSDFLCSTIESRVIAIRVDAKRSQIFNGVEPHYAV